MRKNSLFSLQELESARIIYFLIRKGP